MKQPIRTKEEKDFCYAMGRIRYYAEEKLQDFYIKYRDLLESELISKHSETAYQYANDTQKRFPQGEDAISKSAEKSYDYALNVLHERFHLGENRISKSPEFSYCYARDVIKDRWKPAEEILLSSTKPEINSIVGYAIDVIKGKWPEAEEIIKNCGNNLLIYSYLINARKEKWDEVEEIAVVGYNRIVEYAEKAIRGRWIEGEKKLLGDLAPRGQKFDCCIEYCQKVLHGRWIDLENKIFENEDTDDIFEYAKKVMCGKLPEMLHNKVLMMGMIEKDESLEKYFKAKKYKTEKKLKAYKTYEQEEKTS